MTIKQENHPVRTHGYTINRVPTVYNVHVGNKRLKQTIFVGLTIILLTLLFVTPALAHDDSAVIRFGSFFAGLLHPILGLDHLLAMLAVGIISAQIGGRAIWIVPATFVLMMAVGGLLGLQGIPVPPVEMGIALSVLILGLIIAFNWSLPVAAALVGVTIFAIFHGYAHGAEMPKIASPPRYIAGFMLASTIIHLIGVLVGDIPRRYSQTKLMFRIIGAIIALCGFLFIVGVL